MPFLRPLAAVRRRFREKGLLRRSTPKPHNHSVRRLSSIQQALPRQESPSDTDQVAKRSSTEDMPTETMCNADGREVEAAILESGLPEQALREQMNADRYLRRRRW